MLNQTQTFGFEWLSPTITRFVRGMVRSAQQPQAHFEVVGEAENGAAEHWCQASPARALSVRKEKAASIYFIVAIAMFADLDYRSNRPSNLWPQCRNIFKGMTHVSPHKEVNVHRQRRNARSSIRQHATRTVRRGKRGARCRNAVLNSGAELR